MHRIQHTRRNALREMKSVLHAIVAAGILALWGQYAYCCGHTSRHSLTCQARAEASIQELQAPLTRIGIPQEHHVSLRQSGCSNPLLSTCTEVSRLLFPMVKVVSMATVSIKRFPMGCLFARGSALRESRSHVPSCRPLCDLLKAELKPKLHRRTT